MKTIEPVIALKAESRASMCSACCVEDGTVMVLSFRWQEVGGPGALHGGGTAVSLCAACRARTTEALAMDGKS